MAETRLTNAIVPDVFTAYTVEPTIYRSRFFKSGVLQTNAGMSALLAGGGETYNLPYWQDIAGTSGDVPVEGTDATVNNLAAKKQIFRKQTRNKVWGSNDLVSVYSGSDPIESAANMVMNYWSQAFDIIAIKSIYGVILDNVANDSGDLVNDISGGTGTAAYFSDDAVIDAQAKLGENGTVGRGDQEDFAAILVHPATYAYMRKQDLIDFVPVSGQDRPVEMYMGMNVIVDRNATLVSTVYYSYIFKPGFLQYGASSTGYLPTELNREPLDGYGIDQLITRRTFAIHPVGFQFIESGVSGSTPTDAELAAAAQWDRVFNAENVGMVCLKHKIG